MPDSQGLSNNSHPEPNQPNSSYDTYFFEIHSNNVLSSSLGLPNGLFPVGVPMRILKAFLPSPILAARPAHLNLLDYIRWTI